MKEPLATHVEPGKVGATAARMTKPAKLDGTTAKL